MSEHQVRGCIFTQYTHCKQNELGHAISWTKVLNMSSMSICAMIGNGSWRETEESSALFFLITLSLPSFSFTYWSGHSDKHSNLGSSRCGAAEVLPCILLALLFSWPQYTTPAENCWRVCCFILCWLLHWNGSAWGQTLSRSASGKGLRKGSHHLLRQDGYKVSISELTLMSSPERRFEPPLRDVSLGMGAAGCLTWGPWVKEGHTAELLPPETATLSLAGLQEFLAQLPLTEQKRGAG